MNKEELDLQTDYITFLPPMNEGFHVGYHATPGVVSDRAPRPRRWLRAVARYMQTPGEDVGYAIPDVLACEQQLRRLATLPPEQAMRHQQMIDFRAVLALLLLWDHWRMDEHAPVLQLETLSASEGFTQAMLSAMEPTRAAQGMRVFTLSHARSESPDTRPLALLSSITLLTPAADPGDLSALLPPQVRWYDRDQQRFLDPCEHLNEEDRTRLMLMLRLLGLLCTEREYGASIYSPESELSGLLRRFADDLLRARAADELRIDAGDEQAERELYIRTLAVYGLSQRGDKPRLFQRTLKSTTQALCQNPLLQAILPQNAALPELLQDVGATFFYFGETPIARLSETHLLMPAHAEGESEALSTLADEIDLLDAHDPDWDKAVRQLTQTLRDAWKARAGASSRVPALLSRWGDLHAREPSPEGRTLTLSYPLQRTEGATAELLRDLIGMDDPACVREPFSQALLQLPEGRARLAPLSPAMCQYLQAWSEQNDPFAPTLSQVSLTPQGGGVLAELTVTCRERREGATRLNRVVFTHLYKKERLITLPEGQCPTITLFPCTRLPRDLWKRYYVHTHAPAALEALTLTNAGYVSGVRRTAAAPAAIAPERVWQTAVTERYPAFVPLTHGDVCVGAIVNDVPFERLRMDAPAVIGVDFGSIATTVMVKQGERITSAHLPQSLHRTLLSGDGDACLADELLPPDALVADGTDRESLFYSVMDLFVDKADELRRPLLDGHIYYRDGARMNDQKGANTLYYDLKWGVEDDVPRLVRLFMKQTLLQAALSARLMGAPSMSLRVSMPGALPPHRREAYLELTRGLMREVATEAGLPLTEGVPAVLYATENRADGLYFRGRNEVSADGGYLNLDLGGSTADISLWLKNAPYATAESSLKLGCRQILFESLTERHADEWERDLADAPPALHAAAQALFETLHTDKPTPRTRQKAMLLTDELFATHAEEMKHTLAAVRAEGRISYAESLLLFYLGYLFTLCGELCERAFADPELRPMLPERMELCVAGNGGQLLKLLDDEQRDRLCALALQPLSARHPLRALLPVQSADPKLEVAIGLLSDDDHLQSTLQAAERWNGTPFGRPPALRPRDLLSAYLPLFATAFPQAAQRLMPDVWEGGTLSQVAQMELATIFENECKKSPTDDLTAYVGCLNGLTRIWRM